MELSEHPFSNESIRRESGEPDRSERAWFRWAREAERLLGHDLDGSDVDGKGCGYSLDEAFDKFRAGTTPHAYAALVGSRDRYVGEWQGR